MPADAPEFDAIVAHIVRRWIAQAVADQPSEADLRLFAHRLAGLVDRRGLGPPLAEGDNGTPGGMSEDECAPLVAFIIAGLAQPWWADVARQLVKACFYPEFRICRDSFRQIGPDGACRRQELRRARERISGSHCVDCPHWTALSPCGHAAYLEQEWCGDRAAFTASREVFLPEDFRQLRQWLHAARRRQNGSGHPAPSSPEL